MKIAHTHTRVLLLFPTCSSQVHSSLLCKRVVCCVRSTFGWRRPPEVVGSISLSSKSRSPARQRSPLPRRGPPAVQPAWAAVCCSSKFCERRHRISLFRISLFLWEPQAVHHVIHNSRHGGSIDQQVRWWWWDRARLRKTRHCRDRRHPPPAPTSPEQTKASSVRLPAAGEARVENSERHISSGSKDVERVRQRERSVQPICVVGVPERDGGVREREQGRRMAPLPRSPVKGRRRGRGARRGSLVHQRTQLW